MSGFVARQAPASGVHDPLMVHALVVDSTAVVTVDVVGLHEDDCGEIRRRCALPAQNVIVHATHTHGGPASMPGRLGDEVDRAWLDGVIEACVACIASALASSEPVELVTGYGADPCVARNRRRNDGPVDRALPVVVLRRADGTVLAAVVSYACHPVVLGADNTLLTADYPGVVRRVLSDRLGGGPALFLTGCAGDANTGHSAAASISTAAATDRTFEECERVGARIATAALRLTVADDGTPGPTDDSAARAASGEVLLGLSRPDGGTVAADIARWESGADAADPAHTALLDCWSRWGRALSPDAPATWTAPVSALRWGVVVVVGLPGEPFAAAARQIREHVRARRPELTVLVAGYSNGCPGYLPAAEEYPLGGYEVCDAHRYYGMPGPFAAGALEAVVDLAKELIDGLL